MGRGKRTGNFRSAVQRPKSLREEDPHGFRAKKFLHRALGKSKGEK